MKHAITLSDLLTLFFILAGLALAGFGAGQFFFDYLAGDPRSGVKAGKQGCSLLYVGVAIIVATIFLSGCAGAPPTHVETVEVKVPVAVQPITPAQVPAVPAPLGPRPPSLQQAADAALAKVCEFVGYVLKADPLLRISAGEKPVDLAPYPECQKRN